MFILPYISTSCIILSAIFVAIGWRQINRGEKEAHKKSMIRAVWLAVAFFVIYMSRTVLIGTTEFGGPATMRTPYLIFLVFHIVLAAVAAVMGIVTLVYARKRRITDHRRIGPRTSVVWFVTAFTGVTVFLLLYVIYPPGPTTNLFWKMMGF